MCRFREEGLGDSFPPFAVFRDQFGFVPQLFRCQSMLPELIEAEAALAKAIVFHDRGLSRKRKERILLVIASANRSAYCTTAHHQVLTLLGESEERLDQLVSDFRYAGLAPADQALLEFGLRLAIDEFVSEEDVRGLEAHGWTKEATLDAVLTAAWATFVGTLAEKLGVRPDFEPVALPAGQLFVPPSSNGHPYRATVGHLPVDLPEFAFLKREYGFVPTVFLVQSSRPEVIAGEAAMLRALSPGNRIAKDDEGLADRQILERLVSGSFARFLKIVQLGTGVEPDSEDSNKTNLPQSAFRPTLQNGAEDPDAETVDRVKAGDFDAFESLMNRHSRRVYRTLVGILGDPDEARDAMQDTFLKVFRHIGEFQGRSRFSTWLVSIASNTGRQALRDRRPVQSLDYERDDSEACFRPQELRAWTDNPEQSYSKEEVRQLVEDCIMRLPSKYRVVLMLRDMEQLSIQDSAAALGLGVPALKSRHLRGRLMLREELAARFTSTARGGGA
jgi:RNA polymerase sigma-70 factor (ECF subfamily)